MGGACCIGTKKQHQKLEENTPRISGKMKSAKTSNQRKNDQSNVKSDDHLKKNQKMKLKDPTLPFSCELEPRPNKKQQNKAMVTQNRSFLGRGGVKGLAMTVDALDALGSSMSNLNSRRGFISGRTSKGIKIDILAFEVANTIAKGAFLFQSLSQENIDFLKKEVLLSHGVQRLVSTDMKELIEIAAADKREELDVFLREVVRFGNLCKDPQWHNLDRYFSNLKSEYSNHREPRGEAELRMKELTALAQRTYELYHEFSALDRFELDYRRKLEELDSVNLPRKGDGVLILHNDLTQQRKLVRSLKKKSLWSRNLEEIMEKFVDIAAYMHLAIWESFGNDGRMTFPEGRCKIPERLGLAGLALHYANIVNQIDNIASRPTSLPHNTRDTLYSGLPATVKTTLRSRLQTVDATEDLSACQIKAEMERTLHWLVPVASNTAKAHQGFGWVGEWANSGHEFTKSTATNNNLARLQTLYHADKHKTDKYLLELVILLNRLISVLRDRDGSQPLPTRSPTQKVMVLQSQMRSPCLNAVTKTHQIPLSREEERLLDKTNGRRLIPGISKSQEFSVAGKKGSKIWALSKSTGSSPNREIHGRNKLEHQKASILDVMDGLDSWY